MKILYVNWAPLWRGSEAGSGVGGYVQAMARQLAARGHELHAINAGYSYDLRLRPHWQQRISDGIQCHELINGPLLAPGFFNFRHPLQDLDDDRSLSLFQQRLQHIAPDIVHFHNIEGWAARCIERAVTSDARVLYSLHNYHPICNQINLLYRNRQPCTDFADGNRCRDCLRPIPPGPAHERLRRRVLFYLRQRPGSALLARRARRRAVRRQTADSGPGPLPGAAPAAAYRQRRDGMLEALGHCHRLLAVSSWVKSVYCELGLDPARVVVNHIGTAVAEQGPRLARPAATRSNSAEPLELVFLGSADQHKGLPVLLSALNSMADSELRRLRLHLYARGIGALDTQIAPLHARLAGLQVRDGYRHEELPALLAGKHLGVVPPIWWDNAPQVVFELLAFKVPVLGAHIGGIPDFVRHGSNGLLFNPGDAVDLISKLRQALNSADLTAQLQAGIQPLKTLSAHADELETFYRGTAL